MNHEPNTICRCEMIARESVVEAIAEGNVTINDIKRRTRAGMGVCQGIYCTAAIAQVLCQHAVFAQDIAPMTARPPMRIIQLNVAAASGIGQDG